ncbi:MAG: DUF1836 domain-containing protein [Lachnospiraceae bacterium]|nr:DUF1836 domain-containing protein [Lachnospiraceae bacterium]
MSREFKDWMEKMARLDYIKPDEIPNMDLYMDQVTTFMETQLAGTKRTPEDKIMTKTMINNYTKNKLLPAPQRKKYSKDHMLLLIFIYYFKSIMSISDLQEILTPLSGYCFGKKGSTEAEPDLFAVYKELFRMEHDYYYQIKENVEKLRETAENSFVQAEGEEGDFLRKLSFITLLSHDIFIRKQMIETMVDEMRRK